jgi:predicted DNA-binding transcriptional regulator AlpA
MSDTGLAEIFARLAALEAAVRKGTSAGTVVTDRSGSRPPNDEPQLTDNRRPRQPRGVRAGLTRATDPANDRRLTKRAVATREGCSTRTIDRRVADGSLPAPDVINGRCFWWLSVLERWEASRDKTISRDRANTRKVADPDNPRRALAQTLPHAQRGRFSKPRNVEAP